MLSGKHLPNSRRSQKLQTHFPEFSLQPRGFEVESGTATKGEVLRGAASGREP